MRKTVRAGTHLLGRCFHSAQKRLNAKPTHEHRKLQGSALPLGSLSFLDEWLQPLEGSRDENIVKKTFRNHHSMAT